MGRKGCRAETCRSRPSAARGGATTPSRHSDGSSFTGRLVMRSDATRILWVHVGCHRGAGSCLWYRGTPAQAVALPKVSSFVPTHETGSLTCCQRARSLVVIGVKDLPRLSHVPQFLTHLAASLRSSDGPLSAEVGSGFAEPRSLSSYHPSPSPQCGSHNRSDQISSRPSRLRRRRSPAAWRQPHQICHGSPGWLTCTRPRAPKPSRSSSAR
jgi:hypothetical protein